MFEGEQRNVRGAGVMDDGMCEELRASRSKSGGGEAQRSRFAASVMMKGMDVMKESTQQVGRCV